MVDIQGVVIVEHERFTVFKDKLIKKVKNMGNNPNRRIYDIKVFKPSIFYGRWVAVIEWEDT